jgi:quercetin dioxygenase-like cupin family protein
MRCAQGLAISFSFHEAVSLPPHSHGAQRGTVLQGESALTRNGKTEVQGWGQSCATGAGVVHSARVAAGSVVLDSVEEADRYALGA